MSDSRTSSILENIVDKVMDVALKCALDTECKSLNCTKGDTCVPSEAGINATVGDDELATAFLVGFDVLMHPPLN